jgi:general stress protein 26
MDRCKKDRGTGHPEKSPPPVPTGFSDIEAQIMNGNQILNRAKWLAGSLLILGLSTSALSAQTPSSRDTLLAAAREIVEAARYCGLVTFDGAGQARIRTMDPFRPQEDWSIWMGTNRGSRKVQDIEGDPRVTLYYSSVDHAGYVAIYGTARLIDDPEEKSSRWKEEWGGYYSDREAQYLLIQVTPERLEVIDYSRAIGGDPESWEPPSVEFPGGG